jgi:hypothetical protein
MREKILGAWALKSFEIEGLDGVSSPWGANARGLLIYESSGRMSVSINRDPDSETSDKFERIFDSILFYSGRFEVKGSEIHHIVENASNPDRIGKQMIRHASLDGDLLKLSSPKESFGTAHLVWRKLADFTRADPSFSLT